jgi:hypothetical protein
MHLLRENDRSVCIQRLTTRMSSYTRQYPRFACISITGCCNLSFYSRIFWVHGNILLKARIICSPDIYALYILFNLQKSLVLKIILITNLTLFDCAPVLEWNGSPTPILVQPTDITRTQYTKCRLCSASPEDEQIMLETCRGPWFLINWINSVSPWFYYTVILITVC